MRRLSFLVLPGRDDGLGGYPKRRRGRNLAPLLVLLLCQLLLGSAMALLLGQ